MLVFLQSGHVSNHVFHRTTGVSTKMKILKIARQNRTTTQSGSEKKATLAYLALLAP